MPRKLSFASARKELAAALAREKRPHIRKRLRAVEAHLAGKPLDAAARMIGIQARTLRGWVRILQRHGVEAVVRQRKPRRAPPLLPLPFTETELMAALGEEKDPLVRKRLQAVAAVVQGNTRRAAARRAKAHEQAVGKWVRLACHGGLSALLRDRRRIVPMTPERIAALRSEIADAMNRRSRWVVQWRLTAIDAVLAGEAPETAARLNNLRPATLKMWLGQIRNHGMAPLLGKWRAAFQKTRRVKLEADPAVFHDSAGTEANPYIRKRLLALAYLAEGYAVDEAAIRARVSERTVRRHLRRFQQGGIGAVRAESHPGRVPKLRPKELEALAALTRAQPTPSVEELRMRVETEFGVRYTLEGFKNMLKSQVGIRAP